jgi:nitric oxide reductase NorE protein
VSARRQATHLPGEVGLWVFIFTDLALFGLYFTLAMIDRSHTPALFARGRAGLTLWIGMANTLILISGSWAVAIGTRVTSDPGVSARYLRIAAGAGGLFLALKAWEWHGQIAAGHMIGQDPFQTWYFFLTGFHAIHVAAAIALLLMVAGRMAQGEECSHALTEATGCYWHLVDLLWVGIYLVVYLL